MPQAPAHHAPSAVPEPEAKDLKSARRAARREDYRSGHRLRTLIVGTLASLMVTFGSIGVGWLPEVTVWMRYEFVRTMRLEVPWVITSIVSISLGAMILCREWLRIYQKFDRWNTPGAMRWMAAVVTCWSLPQVFGFILFSRDVFSYYAQGVVSANGLDPYVHGVSSINNYLQKGADTMWAESPPPYGPVFIKLEEFIVRMADGNIDLGIFYFKLLAVLSVIAILYFVVKIAQLQGNDPVRSLWLVGANPLFMFVYISSAHNDALMTAFMIAALYVARRWRNLAGGIAGVSLVALGVAVKPLALIVLPFVGLLWAGKKPGWIKLFSIWALSLVILMAEMAAMGAVSGLGFGWVKALSTTTGQFILYTPLGALLGISWMFTTPETFKTVVQPLVELFGKLVGFGGVVALAFIGRDRDIIRRAGMAIIWMLIWSPMIQSWYLMWAIPIFMATGLRSRACLVWYFFSTLFFVAYAVIDQLNVSPYLENFDGQMGRFIASIVCCVYVGYLILLDPGTNRLLRGGIRIAEIRRTFWRLTIALGISEPVIRWRQRARAKKASRAALKAGSES
ncbi:MAG: polyprenol phosphomannose-dependent alpha 1,6 mannosyltransferase MptB [Rothia sp. (in: high G+C Gram-positive bacteria)]|uniref:polyprenol phosphomannose-dependent alpha 1,6 mannosyltransferase MptB n=1 Tax=Rothia sp. (in: high G+C Gram-positive bacteria) TaxID=1885016 RepID=UPI0026DFED55|nr:polyprenol phosphomannose-dependent alpha 1,6 mannosyltransferase MptB [Rothia sp. (in: high G+C Gram-positive bacteria)]MDO5750842.1 polyprenol phosphomannose-dependent alpha 1,6 mannosyltransferase MptB [Rothia sp. (in: high G+C Gram-positive bacteria)]